MAALQIVLFGGFELLRDGEALPPIPSRAGRALFAYLVVHRGVRLPRERLAAEFWPDMPESRARRRLSHTLWQIQDTLADLADGHGYLEATGDALSFDPDVPYWIDVEEFERRIERFRPVHGSKSRRRATDRRELVDAVALYRGEFLPTLYDDWVLAEQERLSQLHAEALGWLVSMAKGEGAYEEALGYAQRLTQAEPLREDAHREVMRLSTLLGRTSAALRQFERCRAVLASELGTTPADATVKLHDRIAKHRHSPGEALTVEASDPLTDEVPLVGRDPERKAVVDVLEQALAGRGSVLLIEGDAGMGKSRLAAEGADDAQWRGFTVLYGNCGLTGGRRPYAPLVEALDPEINPIRLEQLRHRVDEVLLRDVARALPSVRSALGPRATAPPRLRDSEGALRMREGFARTLAGLASVNPTVLILEDVHEADADTLHVLEALANRLGDEPLVLVLTYRTDEARQRSQVWAVLRALDRTSRPQRIVLAPLSAYGTAELTLALLHRTSLDPEFVTALQAGTGGNPLFVLETLRAMREQGVESIVVDGNLPLSGGVRNVVSARLDHLTAQARDVLEHAAVYGDEVELDVLAEASERERVTVADALDDLLRRGLLVSASTGQRFRHDLVRRVVLADLGEGHRRSIHRRIGEVLAEFHPDRVEELAYHTAAAGDAVPAIRYLREAGKRAIALDAYETAHAHLARAAELLDHTPTTVSARFELLADWEEVLAVLGRRDEQGRVLDQLAILAADDPCKAARAASRRALYAAHVDRFQEAEEAGRRAVELAERADDPHILGDALAAIGTVLEWAGRPRDAIPVYERAEAVLVAVGASSVAALLGLGTALRTVKDSAGAATHLERARARAAATGDAVGEAQALGQLAAVQMETGDVTAAREQYRAAVDLSRATGFRYGEAVNLVNLANLQYVTGNVASALQEYGRADAAFRSLGQRRGMMIVKANASFVTHAVLGQDDEAAEGAEQARRYFEELGDGRWAASCLATLASIAIRRDQARRGEELCARGLRLAEQHGVPRIASELRSVLAMGDLRRGDPEAALGHLDEALGAADLDSLEGLLPHFCALRADALLAQGDVGRAVTTAMDALGLLRDGVARPYLLHLTAYRALEAVQHHAAAQQSLEAAHHSLSLHVADLDDDVRETALSNVPEHGEIVAAWVRQQPTSVHVRLTSTQTPTGRPVTEDDLVEVALTVDLDDGNDAEDRVEARQTRIRMVVEQATGQGASPTVEDLAGLLGVSVATIRRDLRALRDRGLPIETRGSRAG